MGAGRASGEGRDEPRLPVTEQPEPEKGRALHPAFFIFNWIFFSNATILFNKWLLDTAGFKYPILLTCWHLFFSTVATQVLARTTSLLDGRFNVPITGRFYLRTIVPIGVLYTGSLVCSNLVYLYLSVAFTQMLKSASPVAVLFTSWAWGVAEPDMAKFINIVVIVIGVAIASFGEIEFKLIGFIYQVGGIVFEAMRIVMIQVMLSGEGVKMDPLVGLYYYAPVCTVFNIIVALFTEVPRFQFEDLQKAGFFVLFLNALVAFMLNIASVFLIGKTSGLVLTLTGIFKSILLVIISIIIWHTEITALQGVGYFIALIGLTYYSLGYDQVINLYLMSTTWASSAWNSYTLVDGGSPGRGPMRFLTKRHLFVGVALLFCIVIIALVTLSFNGTFTDIGKLPGLAGSE